MCTAIKVNQDNYEELPILGLGSQGEAVKNLQLFLCQLGHYFGDINGYFCINTQMSVRVFQMNIGIRSDGVVNKRTWNAINRLKKFLEL